MATADTTPEGGSNGQPIGTTLVVHGAVQAYSAEGTLRVLQAGSPIFLNDRIVTGDSGMVSILFGDAAGTQLDLGRMSDVLLDEDVFQEDLSADFSEAAAEVEQIQEALLTGTFDPTTDLEPTAAGPAAGGPASDGGGSSYVEFSLSGEAVTPTSGAETTGVGLDFLDSPPPELDELIEPTPDQAPVLTATAPTPTPTTTPTPTPTAAIVPPPPPPPPSANSLPSSGEFSSFVEERGLNDGTDGPDSSLTITSGTLADLDIDFGGDGAGFVTFSHGGTTVVVNLDGNPATTTSLAGTYGTLTIFGDGTWQYEITDNTIDHPDNTTADGDGTTGADDALPDNFTFTVFDADGDSASGSLTISIYDDGPRIGTPQDSILALEEDNSLTASLDIEAGADQLASLAITLTEGDPVMTTAGIQMTNDGNSLFWHENEDSSWSAVTKDKSGELDPEAKSFTVSVDLATGTYTVFQDGQLDGATKTIDFDNGDALHGGNKYEAVFGSGGSSTTDGKTTTYTAGVFIWARGSEDHEDPFGWNGSADNWVDNTATVNWAGQGIGVDTDAKISGSGGDDGSTRDSQILSIKFFSTITVDDSGKGQDAVRVDESQSAPLDLTGVTLILDHLGTEESAYYTLWNDGEQVSGQFEVSNDIGTPGGNSSNDYTLAIDSSKLNPGQTAFDEVRLESSRSDGDGEYRIQSAQVSILQEGYDQTIIVPFELTDADGDTVSSDFSITFDGDGVIDATAADSADGDVSTNGMVISGSSGDDSITGTDYNDTIDGGAGDDTIEGGSGNDLLVGNVGDDFLNGGEGDDELDGGEGNDQLIGGEGEDTLSGGDDDDVLVGDDVDFSDPADPVIVEDGAADDIDGGAGNDTAGDQPAGDSANDDTITGVETNTTDIDTLVAPPDDV